MDVEYLTPEEVAVKLRVTPEAVQGWCRSQKLKAISVGRRWRITPADLEAFIRQQTQEALEAAKKANGLVLSH